MACVRGNLLAAVWRFCRRAAPWLSASLMVVVPLLVRADVRKLRR